MLCCVFVGCVRRASQALRLQAQVDQLQAELAVFKDYVKDYELAVQTEDYELAASLKSEIDALGVKMDAAKKEDAQAAVRHSPALRGARPVEMLFGRTVVPRVARRARALFLHNIGANTSAWSILHASPPVFLKCREALV